jgi:mannosyltransferase OCH1-like enzyme
MNFPKNIFQTWKTKDVPDNWKEGQQSVINMNPGWNYTLLTDTDNDRIVRENFPDFYPYFISLKYPIQRADAVRYCVLYLYGGIYLDLDFICNKSFDDLSIEKEIGLTYTNSMGIIHYYEIEFIISQPKCEFWLKVLNEIKKPLPFYKKINRNIEIMYKSGPLLVTGLVKKYPEYVQTLTNNISVKCTYCQDISGTCYPDNNYYLTPTLGGSWFGNDTKALNSVRCNKIFLLFTKHILLILLILIIIILYKKNIIKR